MAEFNFEKLKSLLLNTGLQVKDNALYQVIHQLIGILSKLALFTNSIASSSGSGIAALINQTYITVNDNTTVLPNSSQLIAGTGIILDTSIPNQIEISVDIAAIAALLAEREGLLSIKTLNLDLIGNQVNGKLIINDDFDINEVGPVIMTQKLDSGTEFNIVLFAAEILDKKRMKINWYAPGGAPRKVKVNYISRRRIEEE